MKPGPVVAVAVRFSTKEALTAAIECHQAFWSPVYSDPNARAEDLRRVDALISKFQALTGGKEGK